jgi:non-homologous end joining protein Ku
VPNTDLVKGFEFEKGRYVVIDEDIDKVRVQSTRVINLEQFTDDVAIDRSIWSGLITWRRMARWRRRRSRSFAKA